MWVIRLSLFVTFVLATPILAQEAAKPRAAVQSSSGTPRYPVATQPSNNPFSNPIGQGVPRAASANSSQNGNRTNPVAR